MGYVSISVYNDMQLTEFMALTEKSGKILHTKSFQILFWKMHEVANYVLEHLNNYSNTTRADYY